MKHFGSQAGALDNSRTIGYVLDNMEVEKSEITFHLFTTAWRLGCSVEAGSVTMSFSSNVEC